jgi:hypothetical protein
MSWSNNNLNINNHYRNVMARYERGEPKISLRERGFMYSYGDRVENKVEDGMENNNWNECKEYFNNLSAKQQRKLLKKMNK